MDIKNLIKYIKSDLYRTGKSFLIAFFLMPNFKYMFFWRINKYLTDKKLFLPLKLIFKLKLILMQYHYGIKIGDNTEIGYGFYIYHFGGIFINNGVKIGNNVDIYQDVTIGATQRKIIEGDKCPIIMNNVVIGAGTKVLGAITIESCVAVGPNAVVTSNTPPHVTVGGIPAKIISRKGSDNLMAYSLPKYYYS